MRFVVVVFAIIICCYLSGLVFPWWIIAVVGFLSGCFIPQTRLKAMLAGFIAGLLLWSFLALFIDLANESILAGRIAKLFTLNSSWLIILLSGFIGGLVTGMAALTGALLRSLRSRQPSA